MAWDGYGGFDRLYNWVADKLASVKITASRMDAEFDNYATGLENCLTRDGQTSPSANIPWNSKKITGLANGTASTDAVNLGQVTGVTTGNAFRRNMLANGGFDVWQSGAGGSASIAGAATRTRTADCWWAVRASSATGYTVSQQTGTVNRYACKWQRDSGNASTAAMLLAQSLETSDVVWLKRGTPPTLTVSFYAKKGANYSGGDMTTALIRGTGTDQNVLDTYTGATTLGSLVQTLTTTMTRYEFSAAADTSTNELGVQFSWTPSGTAGADDSITIENVQVEVASAATAFEYLPFSDTLRRCQRYYQKSFPYTTAPASNTGSYGFAVPGVGSGAVGPGFFPVAIVTKRTSSCTVTTYNPSAANAQVRNVTDNADGSATGGQMLANSLDYFVLTWAQNSGYTLGDILALDWSVADTNF